MEAWGTGIFDNEAACDYVNDVMDAPGVAFLRGTIDKALSTPADRVGEALAQQVLAAADIVACLAGQAGERTTYTATLDEWAEETRAVPDDVLLDRARRAVALVTADAAPLTKAWADTELWEEWGEGVELLSARLDAAIAARG